jgi:OOP family OmpA-OmpF porin
VEIEGHTDNTGSPVTNEILSEARARAVREYLTAKAPSLFPNARVKAEGFGPAKPIADNTTSQGKAQNRRVTVVIGNR